MKKDQQPLVAYEAPVVRMIEVVVEKGFAVSGEGDDFIIQ